LGTCELTIYLAKLKGTVFHSTVICGAELRADVRSHGKVVSVLNYKRCHDRLWVSGGKLHIFSTMALVRGKWSASFSAALAPRKMLPAPNEQKAE
jgi:hypothetical protein